MATVDLFQVVPPCGGHPLRYSPQPFRILVSSRAPVWGASLIIGIQQNIPKFQVVPPCGGHQKPASTEDVV